MSSSGEALCLLVAEFKGFSSHPFGRFTGSSCSTMHMCKALTGEWLLAASILLQGAPGQAPSKARFLVNPSPTRQVVLGIGL